MTPQERAERAVAEDRAAQRLAGLAQLVVTAGAIAFAVADWLSRWQR